MLACSEVVPHLSAGLDGHREPGELGINKGQGEFDGKRKEMKERLPGKGRRQRCIYKYWV